MITCTRRIEFDAAHRVMEHETKCKYLHGHRYVIEATFASESLDKLGRVVDFGKVREILGNWIDHNWDHNAILNEKDSELAKLIEGETGQKIYFLPYNPTAENMAHYLLYEVTPRLFDRLGIKCVSVKLYETPNCSATATL